MALMREKILSSRLYKIVLWIVLGSMIGGSLLVSVFFKDHSTSRGRHAAYITIDGQEISDYEFQKRLYNENEKLKKVRNMYGISDEQIEKMVGYELIKERLLDKASDDLRISITPALISQKMNDPLSSFEYMRGVFPIEAINKDGSVNMPLLNLIIQKNGMSLSQFEIAIENALRRKMVADITSLAIFIDQEEVQKVFEQLFLKYKATIYQIERSKIESALQKQPITESTIARFFAEENSKNKRFWIPEKKQVTQWVIGQNDFGIVIKDEDIEKHYKKNKRLFIQSPLQYQLRRIVFTIPAEIFNNKEAQEKLEKKILDVYEEVKQNPQDFIKLAHKYSDDKKEIDLGFVAKEALPKNLERDVFGLKNDLDITRPLQHENSVVIYQRVVKKDATYKDISSVKNDIKNKLLQDAFKQSFVKNVSAIIEKGGNEIDLWLAPFNAYKKNVTYDRVRDEEIYAKIGRTGKGSFKAFMNKDGKGYIVKIESINPSYEPSLQEVYTEVKNALVQQQAMEKMESLVAQALVDEQALRSIDKKSLFAGDISYTDTQAIQNLYTMGVPVAQLFPDKPQAHKTYTVVAPDGNGYILHFGEREAFNKDLFEEKKAIIKKDLYAQKKDIMSRGVIASLYEHATIQKNK